MHNSKIEWTETTWNPTTGCSKISSGCKNCYAERMAMRLLDMGNKKYQNGFEVTLHPDALIEPGSWKKSKMVFVNSMSDLFHEDIPLDFIQRVFMVMNNYQQHFFQVLTKRSSRLLELNKYLTWSDNIWMGVTIEDERSMFRMADLKQTDARIKFLSCEPLLTQLNDLDFNGIDWVIVGGESGPGSRPIREEWILDIKEACTIYNSAFFFKQWGGVNKKKSGRTLLGEKYSELPTSLI